MFGVIFDRKALSGEQCAENIVSKDDNDEFCFVLINILKWRSSVTRNVAEFESGGGGDPG